MALATPAELNLKIQKMDARVRDLEAALQRAQSIISEEIHPLLVPTGTTPGLKSEEPILVSVSEDALPSVVSSTSYEPDKEEFTYGLSHAFGTLSITTDRGSKVSINSSSTNATYFS